MRGVQSWRTWHDDDGSDRGGPGAGTDCVVPGIAGGERLPGARLDLINGVEARYTNVERTTDAIFAIESFEGMTHRIEVLLDLLGPVAEVRGLADNLRFRDREVEDTCVAHLRFQGGAVAVLSVTHAAQERREVVARRGEHQHQRALAVGDRLAAEDDAHAPRALLDVNPVVRRGGSSGPFGNQRPGTLI